MADQRFWIGHQVVETGELWEAFVEAKNPTTALQKFVRRIYTVESLLDEQSHRFIVADKPLKPSEWVKYD